MLRDTQQENLEIATRKQSELRQDQQRIMQEHVEAMHTGASYYSGQQMHAYSVHQ